MSKLSIQQIQVITERINKTLLQEAIKTVRNDKDNVVSEDFFVEYPIYLSVAIMKNITIANIHDALNNTTLCKTHDVGYYKIYAKRKFNKSNCTSIGNPYVKI